MSPVRQTKAPSCCGAPVPRPNTIPGYTPWRRTLRERARLLSQRHWQAFRRDAPAWGATTSSIRGITSAIRAVEDMQWIPSAITTLHKRIAAGAASARPRPYLPPAGLVILVENVVKCRYGPLLGALAILAWVCFLRVGEVATIRVADSKTGDEGYTTKPLSGYTDQVQA